MRALRREPVAGGGRYACVHHAPAALLRKGLALEVHDVTEAEVGGRCGGAHAEGTMGEALRVGGRHIRAELNCDGIHMGPAALGPLARSLRAVGVCHGVAL